MGILDGVLQRARKSEPVDDRTAERVLDAALQQAEDFGVRRFTIDDVARRVGVSRVTIYRHFPKKDVLLSALMMREMHRFLTKTEAVISAQPTPEDKLAEGLLFCLDFLRGHRLLNRLLRTEPELILPHLTTKGSPLIAEARQWIAGQTRAEIEAGRIAIPDLEVDIFAELIVRTVLSLVLTPETVIPLDDPAARRRLIDAYLRPLTQAFRPPS
ncbi:TetR/AcrR family transcriptional regulator [Spirillospora sp. CA-294931]|uniref:TetR/AcrR family transcriptional regulator n=1 Tax=Spirillospora sp. CA-294931 TaxID=3240042 RepID=UPI003D907517